MANFERDIGVFQGREKRLDGIVHFGGTASELLKCSKGKNMPRKCRTYSGSGSCAFIAALLNTCAFPEVKVLAHSPVGCTAGAILFGLFGPIQQKSRGVPETTTDIITTELNEEDVVFGGAAKLENAIIETDRFFHPRAIAVGISCAAGIIGDDVEASIKKVQPQVKANVFAVHCEGYKTLHVGTMWDIMWHELIEHVLKEPREKKKDTVNIISGPTIGPIDEQPFIELLEKLGVKSNVILNYNSLDSLEYATESAASVALCSQASHYLAEQLEKRWGVPLIDTHYAASIEYTDDWIRKIAAHFGKEKEAEKLIEEEHRRILPEFNKYKKELEGKKVFISVNIPRALGCASLAMELGMKVMGVNAFQYDPPINQNTLEDLVTRGGDFPLVISGIGQITETQNMVQREKPDIYFGDFEPSIWFAKNGVVTLTTFDFARPHMGYTGALETARSLAYVLKNPSYHKKVELYTRKYGKFPYKKEWLQYPDPYRFLIDEVDEAVYGKNFGINSEVKAHV